jgi:hypothetical protein
MDVRPMFPGLSGDDAGYEPEAHELPRQMALLLSQQEPTIPNEDPTMTKLKTQVAEHAYSVDSSLVAEEILRKLRMIKWARHALVNGSDQSRQPKLRGL